MLNVTLGVRALPLFASFNALTRLLRLSLVVLHVVLCKAMPSTRLSF